MPKKKPAGLVVGDLVARVEAPTVSYRVTELVDYRGRRGAASYVRVLPYRRSGSEQFLMQIGGIWVGNGSRWAVIGHD